jgi:hypothetical protein
LGSAAEMKAKEINLSAAMFLFHNFYEKYLYKSYTLLESLLLPHLFTIMSSVEKVSYVTFFLVQAAGR